MRVEFKHAPEENFEVHEGQLSWYNHPEDAIVVAACAGRGGGKSKIGLTKMMEIMENSHNQSFLFVIPDYADGTNSCYVLFHKLFGDRLVKWKENEHWGIDVNGNYIYFRSAKNPKKLRGIHAKAALMDEAAFMTKEAFQMVEANRAAKGGVIYITTTPWVKNWLKTEIYDHRNSPDVHWVEWKSKDNPGFSDKEWERLRKKYGEDDPWFRREYMAEFVDMGGLVYPEFNDEIHVTTKADYDPSLPVYWGMDFGINNPTVVIYFQIDPMIGDYGQVRIFDELFKRGREARTDLIATSALSKTNSEVARYKRPVWVACDPTGRNRDQSTAQSQVEILKDSDTFNLRIKYKKDWNYEKERHKAIRDIRRWFAKIDLHGHPEIIIHPRCQKTIRAFQEYQFQEGTETPEKDGIHDHPMEAVQYFALHRPKSIYYIEEDAPYQERFAGTGI